MNFKKTLGLHSSKGFTIIELIVVIAIIAVLAGIVLVNVSQYVKKAKIAAIKADMDGLRSAASNYFFDNDGSYTRICTSAAFSSAKTAMINAGALDVTMCGDDGSSTKNSSCNAADHLLWVYVVQLPDSTYWCIDHLGNAKAWNSPGGVGCDCDHAMDGGMTTPPP